MAETKAKSTQPIRNNGGVVPRGGAITAGSPITSAPDNLTQGYTSLGVGGTKPISSASANIGTQKAVSAGTFARNMVTSQYVMMRYGFVGGAASTFLNSGAADYGRRSINFKTNRRSYHITSWNYVTGAATKSGDTNDSFNDDHAATPTRAIPGELTYTDHGLARTGSLAVPLRDDYKAKTG
jgi:hypothetical protein